MERVCGKMTFKKYLFEDMASFQLHTLSGVQTVDEDDDRRESIQSK